MSKRYEIDSVGRKALAKLKMPPDAAYWKRMEPFYMKQTAYHKELKRLKNIENALKQRNQYFQEKKAIIQPFVNKPRNNWGNKYDAYLASQKARAAAAWGKRYDANIARAHRIQRAKRQSRLARARYQQAQAAARYHKSSGSKRGRYSNEWSSKPLKRFRR